MKDIVYPSYVTTNESGETLVVTNQRSSIYIMNDNLQAYCKISSQDSLNNLGYIGYVVEMDKDCIYVSDVVFAQNSTAICEERVVSYDYRGNYIETLYDENYDVNNYRVTCSIADIFRKDGNIYVVKAVGNLPFMYGYTHSSIAPFICFAKT